MQYNTFLAITGVIRETSQTKSYNKLGLESLQFSTRIRILEIRGRSTDFEKGCRSMSAIMVGRRRKC